MPISPLLRARKQIEPGDIPESRRCPTGAMSGVGLQSVAATLFLVASVFLSACSDSAVGTEDAIVPATVEVAYTLPFGANSAGGSRAAYDKSDKLSLQFSSASEVRQQSVVSFSPSNETHIPTAIQLRRSTEQMQFELELRVGADAVFRGSTQVELRAGRTTTVTVNLQPVIAGIAAPEFLPTLTAYGDMLQLSAATIFATGDTIDIAAATWTSLNANVATVNAEGTVTARSDGTAPMVGKAGEFSDTVAVNVLATASSIVVSPTGTSIPIGGTYQFVANVYDSHGNPINGRAVSWSSSNSSVIMIDENGLATAVGVGPVLVTATVGGTKGIAAASGEPGSPLTSGLTATILGQGTVRLDAQVLPNGGATQTWFEWDAPGANTGPSLTLKNVVGSGLLRVPVSTTLQGLLPATQYEAKVIATSLIGRHESQTTFTTPAIPPTAETLGVTDPTVPQGVLNGKVNPNGSTTTVWFEWGTDPTSATNMTGKQTVNGFTALSVSAAIPLATPGTVIYYRLVAQSAGGTTYGDFRTFTVLPPTMTGPPVVMTIPAVLNGPGVVTLNGQVNPKGLATDARFEWSLDPGFASWNTTAAQSIGAGTTSLPVIASLFGLAPNTTIYFRVFGSNSDGESRGAILSVNTSGVGPQPDAMTDAATLVGDTRATLNGTVTPNGSATTVWFEYGTDPTLATYTATTLQSIGAGTSSVAVSEMVSGLTVHVSYWYRVVASSAGGTVRGAIVQIR